MINRELPKSLTEALGLIKANGWASVAAMAEWAGVDDATVYEWLKPGGSEPKWNAIRLICRHSGDNRIRMALGDALFAGTPIICSITDSQSVASTPSAVMGGLVDSMQELGDFAAKVKAALADGAICARERATLRAEAAEAKQAIDAVLQAIDGMAEQKAGVRLAR